MLNVGSVHAIRKDTRIWFVAKLENGGPYARSILLPSDIPPHLYVTIFNLPLLDIWGDCQAWWIRLPVVAPGR